MFFSDFFKDRCVFHRSFHSLEAFSRKCSIKIVVLKNFAEFTGKHLFHMFSCQFCENFKNTICLQNTSGGCFILKVAIFRLLTLGSMGIVITLRGKDWKIFVALPDKGRRGMIFLDVIFNKSNSTDDFLYREIYFRLWMSSFHDYTDCKRTGNIQFLYVKRFLIPARNVTDFLF